MAEAEGQGRWRENLAALFMLAVFVGAFVVASGYGERARNFPMAVSGACILLMLVQLAKLNLPRLASRRGNADDERQERDSPMGTSRITARSRRAAKLKEMRNTEDWLSVKGCLLVGALVAGIVTVGVLASSLIFVTLYIKIIDKASWAVSAICGITVTFGIYAIFVWFLDVPQYGGIFGLTMTSL